jgi:carbon-monoxide dehydrogenase large subunit
MEAADADIEFEPTASSRSPAPTSQVPFGAGGAAAYVPHNYPLDKLEPGLNETAFYDPTNFTFPAAPTSARSRSTRRPA